MRRRPEAVRLAALHEQGHHAAVRPRVQAVRPKGCHGHPAEGRGGVCKTSPTTARRDVQLPHDGEEGGCAAAHDGEEVAHLPHDESSSASTPR